MIEVRTREQTVEGRVYKVPTNVNRVDCANARGWQVRFKAQPDLNKFFSDVKHGGAQLAFIAAKRYAQRVRPAPKVQCKPGRDVGIRETQRERQGINYHFIEVSAIVQGGAPKRFYIGTDNTWTAKRRDVAKAAARVYRKQQVAAHTKNVKEQRWKSEARL